MPARVAAAPGGGAVCAIRRRGSFCRLQETSTSKHSVTDESGPQGDPLAASGGHRGVFLSYASEDAEVAARIGNTLREAGIEVWFDQNELRGGAAWDAAIRRQIKTCALFVPVISRNSRARVEGYFRLEWKLAVDRSQVMAAEEPFLLPAVIDGTSESDARVPDKFHEVQWMWLRGGETPLAFVERVSHLLTLGEDVPAAAAGSLGSARHGGPIRASPALARRGIWPAGAAAQSAAPAQGAASEKSIAVLPVVDMSYNKEQEYFTDGLTEELIGLRRVSSLPARRLSLESALAGAVQEACTILRAGYGPRS